MAELPELDEDKIDEVALAMLLFSSFRDGRVIRAWKGMAWEITDRLYEKNWITNPKSKTKSVILTREGERLAEEFVRKHFARSD